MAEAVTSVLVKLADILLENVREVQAVRGQIEQVQKELRLIQALLRDIDSKCNRNNVVTEWLNQVREIAKRIATVIATIRGNIEENRAGSSDGLVRTITKAFKRKYKAYKLGQHDELEKIIEELDRLYRRRSDLRIEDLGDDVDDVDVDDVDDPEVVGLEDDQAKIIEQLLDSSISRRTVLSIVGTGGLGKTTLAQKVYNSNKLEGQFDCRAWQSISQTYTVNDLLREILYKVKPHMRNKNPPVVDRDLPVKLKKYFLISGKRYLIILDDVWDINLWGQLKMALPDMYNASRVIITTRSLDIAKAADCNTKPYVPHYLTDAEGLALLFRNAFQQPVQPENYPAHLLDVAKRLTKKCGGLPLALVVLGGILARRDPNYTAWNMLDETIDWHDNDGKQCSQVLAKSYEDLPRYLKDCFLYLAAFPEDYLISGVHVTRMWMAEGFVPKDGAGTIEDRAEKCLEELVQRCLIQVTKKSWNGYCKYCIMHDLLRDLAIRKAKNENFFTVFSKEDVNNLAASKPCRAALQFCTPTEDDIYSENTYSMLCFGFGRDSSNNSGFGLLNYSRFGQLQVLTLERVDMTTFTRRQWSKGLIRLRYLGLRNCKIPHDMFKKFPFSNLETIDLNGSMVDNKEGRLDLCDVVIPTLRHVYGSGNYNHIHLPLKWNKHTNLQTIMDVDIHIESVVELGFCINLRKLGIFIVDKLDNGRAIKEQQNLKSVLKLDNGRAIKEWQNLKSVLKNTVQLVYLSIETRGILPFGGTKELPCHEKIQKLNLVGKWERNICVPSIGMFPTNLTKLQLISSGLQEDPMPILERLQNLRILHLNADSYVGTKLICSTGGFPNLEKLKLYGLDKLQHWDIKEGAMPILRHLQIYDCEKLHVLPELQKVRTLQELTVLSSSRELWEGMQMQGKDVHKIKDIPSVRAYKEQLSIRQAVLTKGQI